jgi:two-component sensor histidine kinase
MWEDGAGLPVVTGKRNKRDGLGLVRRLVKQTSTALAEKS